MLRTSVAISAGVRVLALGAVALGIVGLVWDDFALVWQPVPAGVPGRALLAYLFAAALLAAGIATNLRRTALAGSAALAVLFTLVVILMHGPRVVMHPAALVAWSGMGEQLALASAALIACLLLRAPGPEVQAAALRYARCAFAACLLVFGVVHFRYLAETAQMVPRWLPPGTRFWAAATGVAHIAAGIAILSGVGARLAAVCLTIMFAGFGLLVHAPLLLADAHSQLNWTMNAVNLALTGAAWVVADSLRAPARRAA